jgi:hypothetical protein
MVVIRGRVDPSRSPEGVGSWRQLMGLGRWKLEYFAKDKEGRIIAHGDFRADLSGCFVLGVDVAVPATVEIKVKGHAGAADDSCTVHVLSGNDVVNLPRRLYPCNGRTPSKTVN